MPVKLYVRKASDSSAPDQYSFDEEVISIGRDGANVLTLPDPNRVVSKQHAEIRCRDDGAYLVDLGSKNFTYLNGERLESGRPRALHSGDTIKMGEFEVRFEEVAPSYDYEDDVTVFDASFINPFEDDAQRLVEAFNRICQTFEGEPPARREDALRDAMRAFIIESEPQEAKALLADLLGLEGAAFDPDATITPQRPSPSPARPSAPPERSTAPPARSSAPPPAAASAVTGASASRQEQVLQVMLEAVAKLIAIPAQFRYEFIGQTIMHAPEASFLYEQDADLLARHLLDPALSGEDARERLDLLREALANVAAHQFAMLEGYKAAVKNGAERLVDYLDPSSLVEELEEGKALHRWMPGIAKQEALDQIQERCRDLRESDWSVSEQRFYRPEFIRAYLAREASGASGR